MIATRFIQSCAPLVVACVLSASLAHGGTPKKQGAADPRAEYLTRVQEQPAAVPAHTTGSLWVSDGVADLSGDNKAHKMNDTVVILVSVNTTAAQTGNVNSQRAFQTSSAITALPGKLKTGGVNPLFGANSSTQLKGTGSTDSSTMFETSMTAQVVAVLPSGNLVVEAQRKIFMNNQHEDVTVRGVLRPQDIGSNNTVPSTALSNLEIEMKGKGIIADSVRSPNRIMRTLLWLVGF